MIVPARPCHCRTGLVEDESCRAPPIHDPDRAVMPKGERYRVACGVLSRDGGTIPPGPAKDADDDHLVGE